MSMVRITDGAALDRELSGLAEAIRQRGGTTAQLTFPGGSFQQAVEQLPTGGAGLFDACLEGSLEGDVVTQARKLRENTVSGTDLVSFQAPQATVVLDHAFSKCPNLTKVELPVVQELKPITFYGCAGLPRLELPAIREMWGVPFPNFVNKLVLPGSTMCILHDSRLLDYTDEVYVPRALLQKYRSDTNWSYGADFIYAIEDGGAA